ncbi:MAG: hypothetical protein LBT89_09520 [Planctomycetaceae bacterium]|nr:hypothetical protein [Planctomycetaceae bacterium]
MLILTNAGCHAIRSIKPLYNQCRQLQERVPAAQPPARLQCCTYVDTMSLYQWIYSITAEVWIETL